MIARQILIRCFSVGVLFAAVFLAGPIAPAEVVRFEITSNEPYAEGKVFGNAGTYRRILGKVYFAIDPDRPQNAAIIDLKLAPRNAEGLVEFSSDLYILAPVDLRKGNRAVLYGVNNRGRKRALRYFNDDDNLDDSGDNGFLMRHGFTVVWSGWDGELLPGDERLQLFAPVATEDGRPITARVRYEIVPGEDTKRTNINRGNHGSYRPTENGLRTASLTWRLRPAEKRVPIPRNQYRLHVTEIDRDVSGQLPKVELEMPADLKKAYLYDLIYEARDPLVHGVCFASVRDLISAIKRGTGDGNPLTDGAELIIQRVHGFGTSQSGRFLREFLYWGFNTDEQGLKVFDGVMPHVAGGGLGSFNHRFAQPNAFCCQHEHHDYVSDRFPFSYETQIDPLSGHIDGILQRAADGQNMPFVMHTQSSSEYWSRSGSLVHTDPLGKRDSRLPANVRVYTFGGTQHGPSGFPPKRAAGQNLDNPGDYKPLLRALLLALDRWAREAMPAPPSVYPTIRDGTLVDFQRLSSGFPPIPGIYYPQVIQQPLRLDFGSRWERERRMDIQPPKILGEYKVLVPKYGPDGNELGCLNPPEAAVPLATFTPWNPRSPGAGAENELVALKGSYIPFALTRKQQAKTGDPRLSIQQRYGTLETYLKRLRTACLSLVKRGYLLDEEVETILHKQKERAAPLFAKLNKSAHSN